MAYRFESGHRHQLVLMKKMHRKHAARKCGVFAFFSKIRMKQTEKIKIDKNV